ncbi:hypothetical protein OG21DRAFT_1513143 [Imleria badia]|nr:hypothetical protein OG21DRAFT_1513143 [Imleria badia]
MPDVDLGNEFIRNSPREGYARRHSPLLSPFHSFPFPFPAPSRRLPTLCTAAQIQRHHGGRWRNRPTKHDLQRLQIWTRPQHCDHRPHLATGFPPDMSAAPNLRLLNSGQVAAMRSYAKSSNSNVRNDFESSVTSAENGYRDTRIGSMSGNDSVAERNEDFNEIVRLRS